ncbi:bifunctional glycosyltransferase family 2/GtrA family protein [Cellulomonas edaphi]|uniref:Bifunctional glycosyltransferase family 2/GtrA family protein n=1 Tax=Cellulomonas edaphi TaxID=3053468 RepID=A0ABT7SAA5_9CELL|nr:bifunctional glycosyltransferase family 2/GtrA family protein [Cellulomons edaphi]MDM7832553.1 bifunctional glycosyltransferase family 2/GtrA family protein [Cellulomons edaphi]
MIVLVPAYEPDERLVALVRRLRDERPELPVVVVDDGSGPEYRQVFAAVVDAGATVLVHGVNRGKGRALKTGFAHVAREHPGEGVVCADCDGQHTPADVLAVADHARATGAAVVLGSRRFTGAVPLRSRFGNGCTRVAFRAGTGRAVQDTQTGLRAYPAHVLPWLLGVRGERFEYELVVLLRAAEEGLPVEEMTISTVYLDGNSSSHFRPVVDSVRIYAPLLRFAASSSLAFVVDAAALVVLVGLTGALPVAVLGARVLSSGGNFAVNRFWVFRRRARRPVRREALAYWVLAAVLLVAGYGSLWTLTTVGVPLLAAKVATDLALFVVGFQVQRTAVFTGATSVRRPQRAHSERSAADG